MEIARAHEARLCWMSVYPAQDHQVQLIAELKNRGLVDHFARVRRGLLFRYEQLGDEKGVGDEGAAEDAAGFEVQTSVLRCD